MACVHGDYLHHVTYCTAGAALSNFSDPCSVSALIRRVNPHLDSGTLTLTNISNTDNSQNNRESTECQVAYVTTGTTGTVIEQAKNMAFSIVD